MVLSQPPWYYTFSSNLCVTAKIFKDKWQTHLFCLRLSHLPGGINSINFYSQYDECKECWNSGVLLCLVCTVSWSGAIYKSISKEYRCWLIRSTFSPRQSLSRIDILATAWWVVGKWKHCHGILEAPLKSDLHRIDAVMAYIMEFMACGGLLSLARRTC